MWRERKSAGLDRVRPSRSRTRRGIRPRDWRPGPTQSLARSTASETSCRRPVCSEDPAAVSDREDVACLIASQPVRLGVVAEGAGDDKKPPLTSSSVGDGCVAFGARETRLPRVGPGESLDLDANVIGAAWLDATCPQIRADSAFAFCRDHGSAGLT
jgi:hypothetical protein